LGSRPDELSGSISFGDDFLLDVRAYELRSAGVALKLKPIPMELLLLLIEHRGELVTREQIVERIWGKGVFLDTDNSINAAISRIRQALRDDAEQPRFVQTVTGKGYRFIATVALCKPRLQSRNISRQFSPQNPLSIGIGIGESAALPLQPAQQLSSFLLLPVSLYGVWFSPGPR